ncbi:MAG: peptide chain release factor N(5)-glutamine methyltransferase [Alphaproteobacteria bacterium]
MTRAPSRRERRGVTPADIAKALDAATKRLAGAGVPEARRDARLLIAHALGVRPEVVLARPERRLTAAQAARLRGLVDKRAERRPIAQILGEREFWSLPFQVTADTLDPRPDSETVIEAALADIPNHYQRVRVLDLGTGTGCLLLALLSELPRGVGIGVDISEAALKVARTNAAALGLSRRVSFVCTSWGEGLSGAFDLIVSNPPYVRESEFASLSPEIAVHEPRIALSGGADGLDSYRALTPVIARLLGPNGKAVVEVGAGQAGPVRAILQSAGMVWVSAPRDLAGKERCVVIRRSEGPPRPGSG